MKVANAVVKYHLFIPGEYYIFAIYHWENSLEQNGKHLAISSEIHDNPTPNIIWE